MVGEKYEEEGIVCKRQWQEAVIEAVAVAVGSGSRQRKNVTIVVL